MRLDVALKNPEYDITRAIRKVLPRPISRAATSSPRSAALYFHGYVSPAEALPADAADAARTP